jgi:uncharacterized protein YjiS (DUF1127 family)
MNIRQKIAQYVAYQRTVRELAQLGDDRLRDLGITRGDIRNVARASAF